MELTAREWEALLDALDYMAGGDEVCAQLWEKMLSLDAERVKIEKVA